MGIIVVLIGCLLSGLLITGCSVIKEDSDKVADVDFTVVEDADVPIELMKLIEEKKANTLRLTYTTKDYTYLVAGYGTQPSSGYSIMVNEIYLGTNAVYADFSLIGPAAGEAVTELPTMPYIVIKMERREQTMVIRM